MSYIVNHAIILEWDLEKEKTIIAIPAIRRIGIIAIALILLIVFFTATPSGRAIAESVIKYIATLFDDGILAINQVGNESLPREVDYDGFTSDELQNPTNDTTICMYVDSFEEFSNATGKLVDHFVFESLPVTNTLFAPTPST